MIIVKSPREIEFMREACRITAGARTVARQAIAAGVTTREIDREVLKFILRAAAERFRGQQVCAARLSGIGYRTCDPGIRRKPRLFRGAGL